MTDTRQRFFIDNSPVRGEVVHLDSALHTILRQRDYPEALSRLLGEMLVASALLASTIKIKGRLSLQAQGSGALKWAMAECNDRGELRALAEWVEGTDFSAIQTANDALQALQDGVLFINIEPEGGERYQGIVPLEGMTLAQCLSQYYDLSAQIPTRLALSSDHHHAGGLLLQLLPRSGEDEQEMVDNDLWPRLTLLTDTLKPEELRDLSAAEILYRLYNQEHVRLPEVEDLRFGCTCSRERCEEALTQIGRDAVQEILTEETEIKMDCQFCNTQYRFGPEEALGLFGIHVS
jgi:molecular chaperone Hsp33